MSPPHPPILQTHLHRNLLKSLPQQIPPAQDLVISLIGNLVTKMGLPVVPAECLPELKRVSHAIAELANIAPDDHQPFVGASAFAHKAGLHASAIKVDPELYNHLDPELVGNDMRILVTEMAGRASVELKGRELGVDLDEFHPRQADPGVRTRYARPDELLVVFCSRLSGQKRPELAVDTIAALRNDKVPAVLAVAGDGVRRAALAYRAARLPVRFAGHIADGHDRYYLGDVTYVREHRAVFEEHLGPADPTAGGAPHA